MVETHFLYLFMIQIYFLIDTNAKMWTEITDIVDLGRSYWSSGRVNGHLLVHIL